MYITKTGEFFKLKASSTLTNEQWRRLDESKQTETWHCVDSHSGSAL